MSLYFDVRWNGFFTGGHVIIDSYFVQKWQFKFKKPLWWIYLFQTQLFTSQGVNWWTGLLQCFYQLFGLSFWRHPFTVEDPLVSKWCNAKSYKSVMMKKQTLEWSESKLIFRIVLIPLQEQNELWKFDFFNLSKLLSNWPLLNNHCLLP